MVCVCFRLSRCLCLSVSLPRSRPQLRPSVSALVCALCLARALCLYPSCALSPPGSDAPPTTTPPCSPIPPPLPSISVIHRFYWYVFSWVCLAFFMLTCGVCGNILGYKRLSKDANIWREHHTGYSVEELVDQPPPPPSYGGPPPPLPGPPPVASPSQDAGAQVRDANWWNRNPMSRPPSARNLKGDPEQIELVQRAPYLPPGGYDSSHVPAAIAVNSLHVQ